MQDRTLALKKKEVPLELQEGSIITSLTVSPLGRGDLHGALPYLKSSLLSPSQRQWV